MNIRTADRTNYALGVWIPTHVVTVWNGDEIAAQHSVMALDADDETGYLLYTLPEWQAETSADFTADLDGTIRLNGEIGPYSIRYAPGGFHTREMAGYFRDEFERVFGDYVEDSRGGIRSLDWPAYVQYDHQIAVNVLSTSQDEHGTTEDGDAEVCAALESAGAVISVGTEATNDA
jgi:hypothetical protein